MGIEQVEIKKEGFALLSGIRRDEDGHFALAGPPDPGMKRKGTLALIVEGAGDHPGLADEACQIALEAISQAYFEDNALSVTSSLLNAIETANSAVLEHCYAPQTGIAAGAEQQKVAHAGGVRARGARVGLTAVLFRPDGTGVYLSQLAPTQAYLVHNGMVSALPEPKGWREGHESEESLSEPLSFVPAQSLGSQPGLVNDLTFRRVEPGDRVILVSTSLARLVDRPTADRLFFSPDASSISEELYRLASDNGLARASASVLEIGQVVTVAAPRPSATKERTSTASGAGAFGSVLAAPKDWLDRRRESSLDALDDVPVEVKAAEVAELVAMEIEHQQELPSVPPYLAMSDACAPEETTSSEPEHATPALMHPTLTLVQREIEPPPYLTAMQHEEGGTADETAFNEWADPPPPLQMRTVAPLGRIESQADQAVVDEWRDLYQRTGTGGPEQRYRVLAAPQTAPPPQIFGDTSDLWEGEFFDAPHGSEPQLLTQTAPASRVRRTPSVDRAKMQASAQRALKWSMTAVRGMLPEKQQVATEAYATAATPARAAMPARIRRLAANMPNISRVPGAVRLRGMNMPPRPVIAAAVGALVLLLILSMLVLGGGAGGAEDKTRIVTDHLHQARQAELIATQPGSSEAARREGLKLARERASLALAADPESVEAKRLLAKVESDLDKLDGVTRLREPKLLFDLDAAQGKQTAGQAVGEVQDAAVVTGTGVLSAIVVQGNDAYLLDEVNGQIYRCKLSTQGCAPILKRGDTAGGQQVGTLIAMTERIGNVVALDEKLVAYFFDAASEKWSAQVLGDGSALSKPTDLATYDGHLYLLGAKAGQIVKYTSGAFGSPPSDWITDAASVAQVVEPAAIAIDGSVYVLLGDGRVLVMQGGKVSSTLTTTPVTNAPATDLHAYTDANDLYILYAASGTITRLSKEGQTLANLKLPDGSLQTISGMTVEEGKSKLYLLDGRKVYEAILPGRPAQTPSDASDAGGGDVAPAGPPVVQAQPTAAP